MTDAAVTITANSSRSVSTTMSLLRPFTFFPPSNSRHQRAGFHQLRVDDPGRRLWIMARSPADPVAQPVVELGDQAFVPPVPEEA